MIHSGDHKWKYPFTIVSLWRKAEDAEVRDFRLPSVEIA